MAIPLPNAFVERIQNDPFFEPDFLNALEQESPTTIRLNPTKTKANLPFESAIPWCEYAFRLSERPAYTLDPLFHAGAYYPQEAGSLFLDEVLRQLVLPDQPIVLDLCAAPGGKSTLIASFLNGNGLLVSNEVIQSRARILKENCIKWGHTNSVVTNNDPADFERTPSLFDIIVVDAPCSGEGMFRKDHQAREEWSPENVNLCSARQRRIVMDVWDALQPGGFLIYSTCTFNAQENEENVIWYAHELNAELVPISSTHFKPGRGNIGMYALPSQVQTEGFYIAILQKSGERTTPKLKTGKNPEVSLVKDNSFANQWIQLENIKLIQWQQYNFAIPALFFAEIQFLQQQLRTIKIGTEVGEIAKKGLIPNESLALNPCILDPSISRIDLNLHDALHYLKGETFPLEGPTGFQLVCFQNEPLGWIKNLGNRFNNLYPKEWRIRMKIE